MRFSLARYRLPARSSRARPRPKADGADASDPSEQLRLSARVAQDGDRDRARRRDCSTCTAPPMIRSSWSSAMGTPMTDELTGDTLFQADFTEFCSTGSYYLEVPGLGRSPTFTVGPNVYSDLLTRAMIGMYGQRCGTAVHITLDGETWSHGACHQNDGVAEVSDRLDRRTQAQRRRLARRRRLRQVHHQRRVLGRHDAGGVGAVPAGGLDAVAADPRARRRDPRLPGRGEVGARLAVDDAVARRLGRHPAQADRAELRRLRHAGGRSGRRATSRRSARRRPPISSR